MPPLGDSASSGARVRVLLVDDHALLRQGMAAIINEEPDLIVCGEADGVRSAIAVAAECRPDIALIDLSIRDRHPQKHRQAVAPEVERFRTAWYGIPIDRRPGDPARADLLHQRDGALQRNERSVDIGAALEPRRRFCLEAEPLTRFSYGGRLEIRAFERYGPRGRRDL